MPAARNAGFGLGSSNGPDSGAASMAQAADNGCSARNSLRRAGCYNGYISLGERIDKFGLFTRACAATVKGSR